MCLGGRVGGYFMRQPHSTMEALRRSPIFAILFVGPHSLDHRFGSGAVTNVKLKDAMPRQLVFEIGDEASMRMCRRLLPLRQG